MKDLSPIYIHSLFRSGSTYIFNKFRESNENFYCYQEPFNEHLLIAKHNPNEILEIHKDTSVILRHPKLNKPYFFEFYPIIKQVSRYLDSSLCYKKFFDSKDEEGTLNSYINCLIKQTDKVPVLQMCRSFGRTSVFNNGRNIFLWRNPWDQWWSYKVDDYFNVRNLLILNADNLPPFLGDIREKVGVKRFECDNIDEEILHFNKVNLNSNQNYLIFYALWCYALIENYLKMDLLLNIDGLSTSAEYRVHVANELKSMNVFKIDFSDCRSPIGCYNREEEEFFVHIETQVHKLLLETYSKKQVDAILSLKHDFSPARAKCENNTNAAGLRKIVIRQNDRLCKEINDSVNDLKEKASINQLIFNSELKDLNKELQKAHEDNKRINELYLLIIRSNSWRVLKRLHPLIDFFKSIMRKNESDYLTLKPSNPNNNELIVDITHIHKKDIKTGIQRVVRSILKEFKSERYNKKHVLKTVFLDSKMIYRYCDNKRIVVPKKGDIYLGLDLNAQVAGLNSMFSLWFSRGVGINFVVFDIIPILHPYWWDEGVSVAHEQWLKIVLKYSSNIVCISEAVANDVRNYHFSSKVFQKNTTNIKSFNLGADIENSHPSGGLPKNSDAYLKKISKQDTFLMIGTIEPRKGYQEALDAFNLLWLQGEELNLVIVGKKGWMMDSFLAQVKSHKNLNTSLFYFDNASDEFLEELYKESTCLIAASMAEGFGLPLIEAAKYNLPIIARDIPVFKEVAADYATFFTTGSLAETISYWLVSCQNNNNSKYENMKIRTWKQSAQELAAIINF